MKCFVFFYLQLSLVMLACIDMLITLHNSILIPSLDMYSSSILDVSPFPSEVFFDFHYEQQFILTRFRTLCSVYIFCYIPILRSHVIDELTFDLKSCILIGNK